MDLVDGAFCDLATKMEWPRTSPEGTIYWPSQGRHTKGTPADLDNARQQFPMRSEAEWVELFDRAPQVMHAILGDIFRETKAEREREEGRARMGRRPGVVNGSLNELYDMITPRYAMEPFPISVRELIGTTSLRGFAMRAAMSHSVLSRLITGEIPLSKYRLESLAKAGRVAPAFFMEYRELIIVEAVQALLRNRPNVSVRAYGALRKASR